MRCASPALRLAAEKETNLKKPLRGDDNSAVLQYNNAKYIPVGLKQKGRIPCIITIMTTNIITIMTMTIIMITTTIITITNIITASLLPVHPAAAVSTAPRRN